MNYPTLSEALLIAAATVGIDAKTLRLISRVDLLDSALYAPQATFDGIDLYEDFHTKAAVLCRSVAMNHPLLDGNKRLAWQLLDYFCEVNGYLLVSTTDEAVHPRCPWRRQPQQLLVCGCSFGFSEELCGD